MERGRVSPHWPEAPRKPALKHLDVAIPKGVAQVARFKMMGFKSKNLLQSQVTRVSQEQRLEDWLGLFEAA